MLNDPQTITISGTANTLPRVSTTPTGAVYANPDSTVTFDVTHNRGRRNKHMVRIRTDKVAADPLLANVNRRLSMSGWFALDVPPEGFTVTEMVATLAALATWLTANSNANAVKVVGGEA